MKKKSLFTNKQKNNNACACPFKCRKSAFQFEKILWKIVATFKAELISFDDKFLSFFKTLRNNCLRIWSLFKITLIFSKSGVVGHNQHFWKSPYPAPKWGLLTHAGILRKVTCKEIIYVWWMYRIDTPQHTKVGLAISLIWICEDVTTFGFLLDHDR